MSRIIRRTGVFMAAAIVALGVGTACATADPAPAGPSTTGSAETVQVDMKTIATQYLDAWNITDPAARKSAVARLYTEQATYIDPLMSVAGHDGIDGGIAAAQAKFPGWVFKQVGAVDSHHNQLRLTWQLGPANAEAPIVGFDVIVVENGRITAVYGFLDKVPAA